MKITEDIKVWTETITSMMDQTEKSKFSPAHKDTQKITELTTVLPENRRPPLLNGGYSTKIGGMWTLKHEIR